jgi:tetratricopeptide (TPR) repeat protein
MEESQNNKLGPQSYTLEKVGYLVVALTAFLLPFFFIPSRYFTIETSKMMLLSVGILGAFFIYLLNIIKRGEFALPSHRVLWAVPAIPLVFLISSLLSPTPGISLFGYGLGVGTWAFVTLGFLLLFLAAVFFQSRERIFYAYVGFLASFVLILILVLAKFFFGPEALTLGVLYGTAANPVGIWTDLAAFFGISAALAVMALEMMPLGRALKGLLYAVLALSIFVMAVLSFTTTWVLLLVFSLVFFVYLASAERREATDGKLERRISYPALALFVVSLLFVFNPAVSENGKLGDVVGGAFGVSNMEVRPSIGATGGIIQSTLQTSPLLGSGPRTFDLEWTLHKPEAVNQSNFWNVSFPFGFGLLPTFIVTTGLIGAALWLLFLVFYVLLGVKALFATVVNPLSRFLVTSSFLVSLFLWIMSIVYVPRVTIFALAFFWSGIFIASAMNEGIIRRKVISFGESAKLSFAAVLVVIALLVGNVAFAYTGFQKTASNVYFQKALYEANLNGDIDAAIRNLQKAVNLADYDSYHRLFAEAYTAKAARLASDDELTDEEKARGFQEALARSINSAQAATRANPGNHLNWITLGQIYEALVPPPFSVEGAFDRAKTAYLEALSRNPSGPEVYLLLARLEAASNNLTEARDYINRSIALKPNYAEAYFLLAQLEVASNNIEEAIKSTEVVAFLSPDNAGIFFQLGLLRYNAGDFQGAAEAFGWAINIVPDYANAQYFLGLSFNKLERKDLAIREFQNLRKTNPDNEEVRLILANLENDQDPFFGAPSSVTPEPENRSEPPIR